MYLILFVGVGALWLLQGICMRRMWDEKLSVSLKFKDSYIYEGEESALYEEVTNDKLLPISALGVHFAMSRNLQFQKEFSANSNVTDQTYRRDVFSFLFHQQVRRTLTFCGKKRGFYQIQSVEVTGYDFFFREIDSKTVGQRTGMYVFPAQVDARRISVVCNAISGMVLSRNRLHPDPFEFSGIRGYTPLDPMNHINWKASSRTGELMVNQFDSTTNIDVTILFDVADPYILKEEDLLEETIRIVSSLAARLIGQKMPVRVAGNAAVKAENVRNGAEAVSSSENAATKEIGQVCSNGGDGGNMPFSAYYPAGAGNIENLNQRLACLDISSTLFSGASLLQKELEYGSDDRTFVFISKNLGIETHEAIGRLSLVNQQVLWVVPVQKGQKIPGLSAPGVKMLPWEVGV